LAILSSKQIFEVLYLLFMGLEEFLNLVVIPRKGAQDSTGKEHMIPWERNTRGLFNTAGSLSVG